MRHRVLPGTNTATAVAALLEHPEADIEPLLDWDGEGIELDEARIDQLALELREQWELFREGEDASDLDRFEGVVGGRLHALMEELSVDVGVLDHPEFWAYLGVRHFWWFVYWRQQSTFDAGDFAKYRKYVDGTNNTECVLLRAYLRGQITKDDSLEPYRLASSISHGADFWRSHVIRVQTGAAPPLALAFAQMQTEDRLTTDPLRDLARRLNRMWSNVVLYTYEPPEAEGLIEELRGTE